MLIIAEMRGKLKKRRTNHLRIDRSYTWTRKGIGIGRSSTCFAECGCYVVLKRSLKDSWTALEGQMVTRNASLIKVFHTPSRRFEYVEYLEHIRGLSWLCPVWISLYRVGHSSVILRLWRDSKITEFEMLRNEWEARTSRWRKWSRASSFYSWSERSDLISEPMGIVSCGGFDPLPLVILHYEKCEYIVPV